MCLAFASIFSLTFCLEEIQSESVSFLISSDDGFLQVQAMPNTAEYLNYTSAWAEPIKNVYTEAVQFGTPIQNATGFNFVVDTAVKDIMAVTAQCANTSEGVVGCPYNMTYDMQTSTT